MSTKSSFKVTSGLDVVNGELTVAGNSNLNGDLAVAGKLKINGSAGTIGQVLVSGGADADPIWGGNIDDVIVGNNRLWLWGWNGGCQLGDNTSINKSSPVQTIAGGTVWSKVSCGGDHTAAIKLNGSLWLWGDGGNYGELGDNTILRRSSPVQVITGGYDWKEISCGQNFTAAIKTDGTLWVWGFNQHGQLGDNTRNNVSFPIQTVAGGTNWKEISCGQNSTAAIKTDGTLWTWGYNLYGQLGDGTITYRSSPVQTICGGNNWSKVSCRASHTAAIKTDGTLWMWGYNGYGMLGDGTYINQSSPVQTIAGGTNWSKVSCGSSHTAAIKTDGTLWLWGDAGQGQLGDNTVTTKLSPVQTICGGTNWKDVSCGSNFTAAIKTDGTLWTCGYNYRGQLGDITVINRSSPVQTVISGTNWNSVSCGQEHAAAITF